MWERRNWRWILPCLQGSWVNPIREDQSNYYVDLFCSPQPFNQARDISQTSNSTIHESSYPKHNVNFVPYPSPMIISQSQWIPRGKRQKRGDQNECSCSIGHSCLDLCSSRQPTGLRSGVPLRAEAIFNFQHKYYRENCKTWAVKAPNNFCFDVSLRTQQGTNRTSRIFTKKRRQSRQDIEDDWLRSIYGYMTQLACLFIWTSTST